MAATPTHSAQLTRLQEILDHTRAQVDRRKSQADLRAMERAAARHIPRGFVNSLRNQPQHRPAIIAELKPASPSKGLIRRDFDAATLARELASAGAAALSVLTEEKWFLGSLANLETASQAVSIPCLRKDFMIDEFQLAEARAHNADAVLLIAAALEDATLRRLARAACANGLDVLCEVHNAAELDRALQLGLSTSSAAIGVNARDLHTFDVSLTSSAALAAAARNSGYLLVAESGIATSADIASLRGSGYSAFLIGETLMRAASPGEKLKELLQPCG